MNTFPIQSTIGIDCDPWTGMGRQQEHYEAICKNILHCEPQQRISAFFGAWEWPIEYHSQEQKDAVGNYLKDLYEQGRIRGAIW